MKKIWEVRRCTKTQKVKENYQNCFSGILSTHFKETKQNFWQYFLMKKKWEVREGPEMQKGKENYQKCDAGSCSTLSEKQYAHFIKF